MWKREMLFVQTARGVRYYYVWQSDRSSSVLFRSTEIRTKSTEVSSVIATRNQNCLYWKEKPKYGFFGFGFGPVFGLSVFMPTPSEIYAPRSLLYHIFLRDLFLFAFIFRSINPKTQKYLAAIFIYLFYLAFPRDLFIQSTTILPIFLPVRDWQPLSYIGLQVFVLCVQELFTWCCMVLLLFG